MPKRKIKVQTDNSDWKAPKKVRKPRKPMTAKQREEAKKRLEKAREVRAQKNPNYGMSGIHESLLNLPDDHELNPIKVKKWIKTQKDLATSERASVRQKVKGAEARLAIHEGYIRKMQKYLRDGDWVDMCYGEHGDKKIRPRCVALAYEATGTPKRDVGTFYPDMGCVYTQEMANDDK